MSDLAVLSDSSRDHLKLVIETARIGIWELDLRTGEAWRNGRHDEIFGYEEMLPQWTYDMFLDHVVEEDRQQVDALQQAAIDGGKEWQFECRIRRGDGRHAWISAAGRPLCGPDGAAVKLIGYVIDISATKHDAARLKLVTQELNHRVRNILAVIKSMIRLSAPTATHIASYARTLEGRVGALARNQELLVGYDSADVRPRDILLRELEAFPELAPRVEFEERGDAQLSQQQGQALTLIFHELLTNAVKYGAFSNEQGRVALRSVASPRKTAIEWIESGGPLVAMPERKGFGSRMIERALGAEGTAEIRYLPGGVECSITLHH